MAMGQNQWYHIWVDEHPFTSYFDVHQGYRVLTHNQFDFLLNKNISTLMNRMARDKKTKHGARFNVFLHNVNFEPNLAVSKMHEMMLLRRETTKNVTINWICHDLSLCMLNVVSRQATQYAT